eukprot:PITA_34876
MARYSSIKSILELSMEMGCKIHQMDVKKSFLNGMIEEEVYIEMSERFETFNGESHVCRLKQAMDEKLIKYCKEDLEREFEMKDLRLIHYFLGMEVWQGDGELFVSQGNYANMILKKFHMERSKPMETPLLGNWREEDATSVNHLSQAMVKSTKLYWKAVKHVLRYLRGTTRFGIWYRLTKRMKLQGFIDVDWTGRPSDRKITSGGIFSIGSAIVSCYSMKQRSVSLSSVEVEYMVASQADCEAILMRKILVGLFGKHMDPTVIYYENHKCYIKLSENPFFHDWSKHIDIQYHHLQYCVQRRIMLLDYIPTKEQDVNI